ncbi:MAG: MATE family efflux transporter [Epulopiscium sp.]|nr:MATE family efflux transporter [Candidatus Epulonipiscium sp.]
MSSILSKKESERRDFVLEGNIWKVVLSISFPLAIYNAFNHLFSVLDTLMASQISSEVVSAVAYLSQIKTMFAAIGTGLAVSGGIIVARCYGAGDIKKAKKYVNTLFVMAIGIALILLITIVPFTKPILRFANTPKELIDVGSQYFAIEIIVIVSMFINNIYIAVEKAKGNTKAILYLNLMVIIIKLVLTAMFIYVFHWGITAMAVATLLSHSLLTAIAVGDMLRADNIFKLAIKDVNLSWAFISPIIILATPIFFERFAFSFGKVIVNSMSASYGVMVVGALGISNHIAGVITGLGNGFQDGESSIISQNMGNKNYKRAIDGFQKTLIINITIAIIGFILTSVFMDHIIGLFAKGDFQFAQEIKNIFRYERYALITLAISTTVMGLLYGLGYTRLALVLNFMRLFVFRIPSLYLLQKFTSLGSESVGLAMMISNGLVGVTAAIVGFIVIRNLKKTEGEQAYLNF